MNILKTLERDENTTTIGTLIYNSKFQILASDKDSVTLRSKLNKLLKSLIENKEDLVTRNDLIDEIWNGNHYIGEKALTHTVCKLRKVFVSLGDNETIIHTVPKSGYSLI